MTDPSPRISILHALSNTSNFTADLSTGRQDRQAGTSPLYADAKANGNGTPTPTPKRSGGRRRKEKDPSPIPEPTSDEGHSGVNGDIKELEILYALWKGAGKSVNLWDWLQGFQASIIGDADGNEEDDPGDRPRDEEHDGDEAGSSRKRRRAHDDEGEGRAEVEAKTEADRDRLHASFVRFCEEARMMGLVRARGKGVGRRADEVVKGVTLV